MKVLHVYAGNLFGGIETLLVTLAKTQHLCPQLQHYFALCFEGRLANELRSLSATVNMLGNVRISRPTTVWKARGRLQQVLQQGPFNAIICHACWTQAIFGSVVRNNHLPLIFWCHDVPNGRHPLEQLAKLIPPDLVIANSSYTQVSVPKLYRTRSEILFYPVICPEIAPRELLRQTVRSEINTSEETVVVIQTSRLERWKGQSLLLSALAQVRHLPNWTCWIAGGVQRSAEAEYFQELKLQVQELGIVDRVLFLGQRTDVASLLAASDIHCQPNIGAEPFGITFIEALYAGLPVVTTALGAASEIIDHSCGQLVPPNDPNTLSEVLAMLITNDRARITLSLGGRNRADYLCNPINQLNHLVELLSQVIEKAIVA
jgi:glycosyltransferase involved in cell wall biosynthesis